MQPVQIHYQGIEPSEALTALIFARGEQLARLHDRIVALRVVVAAPHQHHRQGNHYHVRIELDVPGRREIVVDNGHQDEDQDPYQAVRRAFDAVRRRLVTSQARRTRAQRVRKTA